MKLVDLPSEVLDLNIPFSAISSQDSWFSENPEDELAEFLNFQGYNVLIPVPHTHHPDIKLIRLIPSAECNI